MSGADVEAIVRRAKGAGEAPEEPLALEDIESAITRLRRRADAGAGPLRGHPRSWPRHRGDPARTGRGQSITVDQAGRLDDVPRRRRRLRPLSVLEDTLVVLLAGRAAEFVVRGRSP